MTHTPGPWRVELSPVRGTLCVVTDDTWICGEMENPNTPLDGEESQANARLIAAAPVMLAALERALADCSLNNQAIEIVESAIDEATHGPGALHDEGMPR